MALSTVDISQHFKAGYDERIRMIVLHYTAVDLEKTLNIFQERPVSAHYVIPDPAKQNEAVLRTYGIESDTRGAPGVIQLVPAEKRAWHAGVSYWRGRTNVNDCSIGIEIVYSPGSDPVTENFNKEQIQLVEALCLELMHSYNIPADAVVGHSDIAYARKQDPGPAFPWQQLHEKGIGDWPDENALHGYLDDYQARPPNNLEAELIKQLVEYGYEPPESPDHARSLFLAFKAHFEPSAYHDPISVKTLARAKALCDRKLMK